MNHASLFSGIGGFDLAAREVGWKQCLSMRDRSILSKCIKILFSKNSII